MADFGHHQIRAARGYDSPGANRFAQPLTADDAAITPS